MTLSLLFHDNFSFNEAAPMFSVAPYGLSQLPIGGGIHLRAAKLEVPTVTDYLPRPRLSEMLEKSTAQIGATLILGRAGTGKTALAAEFAKNYERVAWYSVEAADVDWEIFSRYLTASFTDFDLPEFTLREVTPQLENLSAQISEQSPHPGKTLLVFDDIHHVFDAEWFGAFFTTLLYLFAPHIHLLLLSRSAPAVPLWRLRSKQVLGVIDEKLLIFNEPEIAELFEKSNRADENFQLVRKKSFGRIAKLREMLESQK